MNFLFPSSNRYPSVPLHLLQAPSLRNPLPCLTALWLLLWLPLCACSAAPPLGEAELQQLRRKPPEERIPPLLELAGAHPGAPAVRYELARAYEETGETERALEHYRRACRTAGEASTIARRSAVGWASTCVRLGRFEQALEVSVGHKNTGASRELQLIHARALTALEKNELAAATYRPLIEAGQEALAPADYINCARACLSSGEAQEARQILAECFDRHGYLEGLGLQLSLAAESEGDRSASLIYALLESLQAVATGRLERDRLCENLASLAAAGDEDSLPPRLQGFARHLAAEEWTRAFERAKSITFPREAEILRSIVAVRHRPGDRAAREALYRQLPAYRRYAPTYAALIASLRNSAEYRFATARPLLEQVLLIAPEGPVALQARTELAGLLGIEERYAEDVRCEREIVLLHRAAEGGAPPEETVGVLLRILALPEHPYTHRAVLSLRALLGIPQIKAYVRACLPEAPSRARRRLEPFL